MPSRSSSELLSRSSWRGRLCTALLLALCLTSWPLSAQSSPQTSPIGTADYQNFKADTLTISLQLTASKQALEAALSENASLRESLSKAGASAMQHNADPTTSSEADLAELARLRQRLNESDSLVSELRQNLASAASKYEARLATAERRAKALERENGLLKIGLVVAGAVTVGLGIYAIVK